MLTFLIVLMQCQLYEILNSHELKVKLEKKWDYMINDFFINILLKKRVLNDHEGKNFTIKVKVSKD